MVWDLMTVLNLLVGATIAVAFFWSYSDRSWSALLHWVLFYFLAIGLPLWWSKKTQRLLDKLDVPASGELRMAAYYPVLAGLLAMLMGISLIREARIH